MVSNNHSSNMYECEECEKTYANKSNLNRHRNSMHPPSSDNDDDSDFESVIDESTDNDSVDDESMDEDDDSNEIEKDIELIWKPILEESNASGESVLEVYKMKVKFCRQLKKNSTHKAVMATLKRAKEDEDMDFEEALDYAVDKRKFLITRYFAQ